MGYVAVKGGQQAIENALELVEYYRWRGAGPPIEHAQVTGQLRLLIDKVMGEASLYAPAETALALQQVEGDVFEAAFMMRAYRATLSRRYTSQLLDTRQMFVERRISSSFRDIPGGQILGPTRDYSLRLLEPGASLRPESAIQQFLAQVRGSLNGELTEVRTFSKVMDLLIEQGLLAPGAGGDQENRRVMDVTREAVRFPAPRSAVLQMLARAETGGLMCLGYSTMRGFAAGGHGTIGELRVGMVRVHVTDARGRKRYIGSVRVTECEMLAGVRTQERGGAPSLSFGYGLCFGQNETKAICMSMLDNSLRQPNPANPANSQEFVLYHTEVIESYGFTNHLKLPHYVTFQSGLQNLREAISHKKKVDSRNAEMYMGGAGSAAAARSPETAGRKQR
jgi:alpha-D-ribose 1-methylphosphonate 5-triphosphate synthase subunit PhnI